MKATYIYKFNNAPRPCLVCGTLYVPNSPNSKYCSVGCRKKAELRRIERYSRLSKEAKQRRRDRQNRRAR
jgi:hypothetical protein